MRAEGPNLRVGFYRQCRLWHGYLSAFAFGALLFFSVTGIALNHPRWFGATGVRMSTTRLTLSLPQLQALRKSRMPAAMLPGLLAERVRLYGAYEDAEADTNRIYVRMRGARGSSDIRADLLDGSVVVDSERATTIGLLDALHRGEQTGAAWRMFIDIAAGVLIAVSLLGYAIFFSMSTRLTTALLITVLSVVGILAFAVAVIR